MSEKTKVYCGGHEGDIYNGSTKITLGKGDLQNTDQVSFSVNLSNNTLTYSITNPSPRTTYLLNHSQLGIGLYVLEDHCNSYITPKWRNFLSFYNHRKYRRCGEYPITSLSGTISLLYLGHWDGAFSKTLHYVFYAFAQGVNSGDEWDDHYTGYDSIRIGLGNAASQPIRPYAFSDWREVEVTNPEV